MALPEIKVKVSADTDGAEAGLRRTESAINDVGDAASRASGRVRQLDAPIRQVARSSGALQRGVQNASFQIADFAVMVNGGVDASKALAMQLPQLLGGFGVLGAVLSAVVAVGVPMVAVMRDMHNSGQDVLSVFGTLQPLMGTLATAMGRVGEMFVQAGNLIINNLDRIIITAGVAASFFAGKWVVGFVAARIATFSLSAALVALRGAIMRTGIGVLIVAAGEMIYQFTRLVQAAGGFGQALSLLADVGREAFERIKIAFAIVPAAIQAGSAAMASFFIKQIGSMAYAFSEFTWGVAEGMNSLFGTNLQGVGGGITQSLNQMAISLDGVAASATENMGVLTEQLSAPMESVQRIRDLLAGMRDENLSLPSILSGEDAEGGTGGKSAAEKLDEELTAQENRIKQHFDIIKNLTIGGLSDKLGAWGSYFNNLAALTGTNNDKLLAMGKAFSAAQALMDAWTAHNQVLSDPSFIGRPWARVASAVNVLAAGIGAVNAIKSVGKGGTGGTSTASTSAGASAGGNANSNLTTYQISLHGDTFSRSSVRDLISAINQETRNGGARLVIV